MPRPAVPQGLQGDHAGHGGQQAVQGPPPPARRVRADAASELAALRRGDRLRRQRSCARSAASGHGRPRASPSRRCSGASPPAPARSAAPWSGASPGSTRRSKTPPRTCAAARHFQDVAAPTASTSWTTSTRTRAGRLEEAGAGGVAAGHRRRARSRARRAAAAARAGPGGRGQRDERKLTELLDVVRNLGLQGGPPQAAADLHRAQGHPRLPGGEPVRGLRGRPDPRPDEAGRADRAGAVLPGDRADHGRHRSGRGGHQPPVLPPDGQLRHPVEPQPAGAADGPHPPDRADRRRVHLQPGRHQHPRGLRPQRAAEEDGEHGHRPRRQGLRRRRPGHRHEPARGPGSGHRRGDHQGRGRRRASAARRSIPPPRRGPRSCWRTRSGPRSPGLGDRTGPRRARRGAPAAAELLRAVLRRRHHLRRREGHQAARPWHVAGRPDTRTSWSPGAAPPRGCARSPPSTSGSPSTSPSPPARASARTRRSLPAAELCGPGHPLFDALVAYVDRAHRHRGRQGRGVLRPRRRTSPRCSGSSPATWPTATGRSSAARSRPPRRPGGTHRSPHPPRRCST